MKQDANVVQAAGGVLWRRTAEGVVEILLVHRPHYDDWTLPKGKLESSESHEEGALREVEEESRRAGRRRGCSRVMASS